MKIGVRKDNSYIKSDEDFRKVKDTFQMYSIKNNKCFGLMRVFIN